LRVLLDVNVLVRANERAHGSARTLLIKLLEQGHILLISGAMLVELASVLRYPRLQDLYGLTDEQVYSYVQFLREVSELVILDKPLPVPMRDPKDVVVLETAVAGEADVICTLDSDFYAPATRTFCSTLGTEICTDAELLRRIKTNPRP
jgi:putative PIN family toxin of toxin-antitoxin system